MKQIVHDVPFSALRSGDVIQAGISKVGTVNVERDVVEIEPPKPAGPKPGTTGTAVVDGKRIPGMIDEDGDFNYLEFDSYDGAVLRGYTVTKDFVPDSDEKPAAPAAPQITWEHFINTMNKVVEDNNLHVGGDFERAIVFAADRLGLY